MSGVTKNLKNIVNGISGFIFGFIIGTILDVVFFRIYKKIDPEESNNIKLFTLEIIQLMILVLLIGLTFQYSVDYLNSYFIRIGILSSQLFLLEFALERISILIYDRNRNKNKSK
jgi:formate hydrogenlyase subunit 3/multisubunit Na+/H+ antiporter MnhD subunit